jgi:hypothetical protein
MELRSVQPAQAEVKLEVKSSCPALMTLFTPALTLCPVGVKEGD